MPSIQKLASGRHKNSYLSMREGKRVTTQWLYPNVGDRIDPSHALEDYAKLFDCLIIVKTFTL